MRYLILGLFLSLTTNATLNNIDKQEMFTKNILPNGGFENGKAKWAATGGTFALVTSGTNLLTGAVSATWDSGSAAQVFNATGISAIPKGLYGKNGVAACKIQTPSGTATHTFGVHDVSNALVTVSVTSSTLPGYVFANFIFPSSGSMSIRFTSVAADEPLIVVDDCFVGDASEVNLTNVSQASFIGSAYIPVTAACIPTRNNTAMGAFGADADCPGPTVELNPGPGTIQTTDANGPSFTVNNLPPGTYRVRIHTSAIMTAASGSTGFAIFDGTNTYGEQGGGPHTTATRGQVIVVANFTYSSAGDRTFVLHARASAGTVNLDMDAVRTYFTITRFPNSTEQAYRPDAAANSWSGYHSSDCSWARTNAAYGDPTADATCTFTQDSNSNFGTVTSYLSGSDKLPGIVFTPSRAGRYFVCGSAANNTSSSSARLQLINVGTSAVLDTAIEPTTLYVTTKLCGIVVATSTSAVTLAIQTASGAGSVTVVGQTSGANINSVNWSIFAIDQQLPAPLLVNSVVSTSSGVTKVEAAKLNCDAGSAITSQHGSWVSSIGNISAGACAIVLSSGFSATPYCTATPATAGGFSTGLELNVDATSSTAVSVDCEDDASSACTSFDFILQCVGPK